MAGQGATTRRIAENLADGGWTVVYTCIPNTPHVNVVPIPLFGASAHQRYPDIVAFRRNIVLLVEVEIRLDANVATDILLRFTEMLNALNQNDVWDRWKAHILATTRLQLPQVFQPKCELILCNPISLTGGDLILQLENAGIAVKYGDTYVVEDDQLL